MRSHYSGEIVPELNGKSVTVSGWVHEIRDLGKLKFLILRDREGFIQVTAKEGITRSDVLSDIDQLSKESIVEIDGRVKRNEKAPNGVEINPDRIALISRSDSPLPLDVTQKVSSDLDTRLNNRFMDIRKPEISAIFKLRGKILGAGREFLKENGFIEIHTPKIIASASEGGTELFPISYFDREAFLAQSPQLYKQMMMATGLDRVYEITTYFRAEEHDTRRHLNVPRKIERIEYDDALKLLEEHGKKLPWGEDLDTESEKLLGRVMREEFGSDLYFVIHFPLSIKPFYTMPRGERYSRSFDLGYKGVEIASGGQSL